MTLPTRSYAAFLFDMDGTILTSIASAERTWTAWAIAHGLDVATFLPTIHGVQSVETVRRLGLPGVDPVVEAAAITAAEMEDVGDITSIRGAADFLATLPAGRWTIVTSAPRALAERRLAAAGLAIPAQFIAAEDVANGKPAPDCFLLAAERLGVPASDCLVFEDAPAGIAAADAAGSDVVVITATHGRDHRVDAARHAIVDYDGVELTADGPGRWRLGRE
ncbi:HAD-IA family hydrolase [Sphingomonas sp. STIS6.2]|uniref:HAD-IA family hydrolase n=1 Tax=Sphingomonas sp. STIS6.2 TaxID=1379700 RepID=UPI0004DB5491|nr:HAD-IA family hydrolase [Sphingomonas sp. STIS6.2]